MKKVWHCVVLDPGGEKRWAEFDPARREYDYLRLIDDIDYDKLTAFCNEHNISLTDHSIPATLEIINQKPIVKIGNIKYHLKSLQQGSTLDILEAADSYRDTRLNAVKLRTIMGKPNALTSQVNFNQIFRNNDFGKGNLLHPFAEISSTSFMLKSHTKLSPSELSAIQRAGTN